jgi:CheY-like chemotaxis protein
MSETRKVRVILVEDHIAFRQALAFFLGREPDLEVVAQAGSLAQAREVLVDGHIDVAVVDLSLPDGDGRDLIGELRRRHSGISVVVLSATIEAGHHEEVLKAVAGRRRDLITDQSRTITRLREALLSLFPALKRALDLSGKGPLILLTHYQSPAKLRRAGQRRVGAYPRETVASKGPQTWCTRHLAQADRRGLLCPHRR